MRTAALATLAAVAGVGFAMPAPQQSSPSAASKPLPTFKAETPEQQKQKLDDSARATPSAVRFVPGAQIPDDVKNPKMANSTSAAPKAAAAGTCTNPEVYVEWRDPSISDQQRKDFVGAMHCLTTKESRGIAGAQSLWDDLAGIHRDLIASIHSTGAFLHWHRYFMWILKQEMRNSCGYQGPMLWWDETKDSGRFSSAPLLNSDYFGDLVIQNPTASSDVTNGQFANLELHIGPNEQNTNRILSRAGSDETSGNVNADAVNTCWSWDNFVDAWNCIELGPHANGHNAIGGIMGDVSSSPGDPMFFMHHLFIDHTFRRWQNYDTASRAMAVGGPTVAGCTENCEQVTLDYQLTSYNFAPAHPISDVADTLGDFLCYKYDY